MWKCAKFTRRLKFTTTQKTSRFDEKFKVLRGESSPRKGCVKSTTRFRRVILLSRGICCEHFEFGKNHFETLKNTSWKLLERFYPQLNWTGVEVTSRARFREVYLGAGGGNVARNSSTWVGKLCSSARTQTQT